MVAFHGGVTWLTFRVWGVPLAYTATLACCALALLPFIPTHVIALPAAAWLAVRGQLAAAVGLFLAHFASYWAGDMLILEGALLGGPRCRASALPCLALPCLALPCLALPSHLGWPRASALRVCQLPCFHPSCWRRHARRAPVLDEPRHPGRHLDV